MPLKMYLDGSKADGALLTLGSVVADESVWSELEPAWDEALRRHGVTYSHMKELTGGVKQFGGWTAKRKIALLNELVHTLERFGRSDRIRQYGCWVDIAAHKRWSQTRSLPSPERLCARILFPTFIVDYPGVIDTIDVWFDQGEGFMTHLREDWENPKIREQAPVWKIVRTIAPADMKKVPPLQVADLIAWSRNRFEAQVRPILGSDVGIDEFSVIAARVLNHGLRGLHKEAGEQAMAQGVFREEGLRRLRLFDPKHKRKC